MAFLTNSFFGVFVTEVFTALRYLKIGKQNYPRIIIINCHNLNRHEKEGLNWFRLWQDKDYWSWWGRSEIPNENYYLSFMKLSICINYSKIVWIIMYSALE